MMPQSPLDIERDAEIALALQNFEKRGHPEIKKVRYTHDAMIDLIIENPAISQGDIAKVFGYTQAWVSIVINSDAFQARLEARKEQLVDPSLRLSLKERFGALVMRSLDVLQEKLSKDADKIPDNLALRAVELGAKALGVGGNAPPPAMAVDHLSTLAERLLALQGRARNQPSEVLTYDEGSSTFGPPYAQEPHAPGHAERESARHPEAADAIELAPAAYTNVAAAGCAD